MGRSDIATYLYFLLCFIPIYPCRPITHIENPEFRVSLFERAGLVLEEACLEGNGDKTQLVLSSGMKLCVLSAASAVHTPKRNREAPEPRAMMVQVAPGTGAKLSGEVNS